MRQLSLRFCFSCVSKLSVIQTLFQILFQTARKYICIISNHQYSYSTLIKEQSRLTSASGQNVNISLQKKAKKKRKQRKLSLTFIFLQLPLQLKCHRILVPTLTHLEFCQWNLLQRPVSQLTLSAVCVCLSSECLRVLRREIPSAHWSKSRTQVQVL